MSNLPIDCLVWRHNTWIGVHLSVIKKGDWFRIPGSDGTHVANEDATQEGTSWHVDADWYRKDPNEKTNMRRIR